MRGRVFGLLLLVLLSVGLSVAQEDRLQIVASYSILGDVVANVAGEAADVNTVMPLGADPHSFTPVHSDLTTLADADVVFVVGALFEEGLLEAIENAGADMNIVTASACVQILEFDFSRSDDADHAHEGDDHAHEGDDHAHEGDDHDHEGDDHAHEGDDHAHEGEMSAIAGLCEQHMAEMAALHEEDHAHDDGDEDHEHEEHEHGHVEPLGALHTLDCGAGHDHEGDEEAPGESEHEHSHGSCDPHVWMNPHNVMYWTMLIRDTLMDLDSANAEIYSANAASYLVELDTLAHDFVQPMVDSVPEPNRILVTNHGTLGYFAAQYDFEIVGTIIGGSTLAEPSAADVAALIDTIREYGVPAIFADSTVGDALAQQIADETGAQIVTLYTGSLSEADGPAGTYIDYMRYNVTTIVEALGGGME